MSTALEAFFRDGPEKTSSKSPEGYCPNCWGEQEYDHVIREMYKDKQVDVNNHEANHTFIQKFVIKRIDGIRLRNGENGYECPNCHYVPEP